MTFIKDYVFVPQALEHEADKEMPSPSAQETERQAQVKQAQQQGGC